MVPVIPLSDKTNRRVESLEADPALDASVARHPSGRLFRQVVDGVPPVEVIVNPADVREAAGNRPRSQYSEGDGRPLRGLFILAPQDQLL